MCFILDTNVVTVPSSTPLPTYQLIYMAQAFSQIKFQVPIRELLRIHEHREKTLSYLNASTIFYQSNKVAVVPNDEAEKFNIQETLEMFLGTVSTCNNQTIDPFCISLLINSWIIHNCMIDYRASINMMSLEVMNHLG